MNEISKEFGQLSGEELFKPITKRLDEKSSTTTQEVEESPDYAMVLVMVLVLVHPSEFITKRVRSVKFIHCIIGTFLHLLRCGAALFIKPFCD